MNDKITQVVAAVSVNRQYLCLRCHGPNKKRKRKKKKKKEKEERGLPKRVLARARSLPVSYSSRAARSLHGHRRRRRRLYQEVRKRACERAMHRRRETERDGEMKSGRHGKQERRRGDAARKTTLALSGLFVSREQLALRALCREPSVDFPPQHGLPLQHLRVFHEDSFPHHLSSWHDDRARSHCDALSQDYGRQLQSKSNQIKSNQIESKQSKAKRTRAHVWGRGKMGCFRKDWRDQARHRNRTQPVAARVMNSTDRTGGMGSS